MTDEFEMIVGVRQGCPLSPIFFSLDTECLMCEWYECTSHRRAPNVSGISVKEMRYADDVVMVLCRSDTEEMLAIVDDISDEYGLVIQTWQNGIHACPANNR